VSHHAGPFPSSFKCHGASLITSVMVHPSLITGCTCRSRLEAESTTVPPPFTGTLSFTGEPPPSTMLSLLAALWSLKRCWVIVSCPGDEAWGEDRMKVWLCASGLAQLYLGCVEPCHMLVLAGPRGQICPRAVVGHLGHEPGQWVRIQWNLN
jgi:hypothetical protein